MPIQASPSVSGNGSEMNRRQFR